jgi:hypothetical protein
MASDDDDFRGMGRMILWPIVVLLVAILIAALYCRTIKMKSGADHIA